MMLGPALSTEDLMTSRYLPFLIFYTCACKKNDLKQKSQDFAPLKSILQDSDSYNITEIRNPLFSGLSDYIGLDPATTTERNMNR